MKKPSNWIGAIIGAIVIVIWLVTNYGMIHSEKLSEAVISDKIHNKEGYYIVVEDHKLHVKDPSTWMLLETEQYLTLLLVTTN